MPSVEEILRQTGFGDDEIARLDPRATAAFHNVLSAAEAARQQAELIGRSNTEFYETTIVPGLTGWQEEQQQLTAAKVKAEREAAWLRGAAREAGILPDDGQGRDGQGRFVAGAPGATPGSPAFVDANDFVGRAARGLTTIADIDWRHRNLYGSPLPIAPSELIAKADALGLSPEVYAERNFSFSKREQELNAQKQAEHDAGIRRETEERVRKEIGERQGSNPDVRAASASRIPELQRKVQSKEAADPLLMNETQRRAATSRMVHDAISERREGAGS
jgi:hypothetical protein